MSKHTEGPWVVRERSGRLGSPAIFTGDIIPIWIADVADGMLGENAEHKANAHLIAAAPEMYNALQKIFDKEGWSWLIPILAKAEGRTAVEEGE